MAIRNLLKSLFFVFALVSATGCSPGMFFGNGDDAGVTNQTSYRRVNTACGGLSFGQDTIDVPLFRKIIRCMNAYGALDPVERLIGRMTDAELYPLVDSTNRYVIKNRTRIHELRQTFETLKSRGLLDQTFVEVARVTENSDFVAASIALARDGYQGAHRQQLLRAFELLSTRVNASDSADLIDALLALSTSEAYRSLMQRFAADSIYQRSLSELTARVHAFISDVSDPKRFELGRELMLAMIDDNGKLFRALDEVIGVDEAAFRTSIGRASSMMKVTMKSEIGADGRVRSAPLLDDVTSLFHYLDRPLYCLKGSKYIPNTALWVIRELSAQATADAPDYVKRSQLLTAVAMNPFCQYPAQLGEYYPSMIRLADTSAFEPSVDFLKSFFRNDLADLVVRMLADTGSVYPGGPPENTTRLKTLLPVLAELTDREAWDDALLIAALPRLESRDRLVRELRFLAIARDELDGKSIYDVLSSVASGARYTDLFALARSFSQFVRPGAPDVLAPALTGLRRAFYVNDVHPVIDYFKDIARDARKNEALFDTLFRFSALPEFEESVSLVSAMAKDGRLKDLVQTTLVIFSGFRGQQEATIRETEEPPFVASQWRRHNLAARHLTIPPLVEKPWDPHDPCRKLDTRIPMDDYNGAGFDEQLTNYVACINRGASHVDVAQAVDFLRSERTTDGRTFLNQQIDLIRMLQLGKEELGDLADRWIRTVDDLRFYRLMDALPYWVSRPFEGQQGSAGPVLRPLLDLFRVFSKESVAAAYRRLSDFAATLVVKPEIPSLLRYGEKIWDIRPEPSPAPLPDRYDYARIAREVRNQECLTRPDEIAAAVDRVVGDYDHGVNNWDLKDGSVRRSWDPAEFKAGLEPLFSKFGDPSQHRADKHVIDGLLRMLRLFTLEEGEQPSPNRRYPREALADFLHPRSNDYRAILYFYPGEKTPRVKLVNTLDRLELVVIDADIEFIVKNNFGLKYLAVLAEAYGDEPFESWPVELQKRYPKGGRKKPLTLHQAYLAMKQQHSLFKNLFGYPDDPSCNQSLDPPYDPGNPEDRRYTTRFDGGATSGMGVVPLWVKAGIFNIGQTLSVIRENLPLPHGDPQYAGGLRVIRDLLWELHSSTPDASRNDRGGKRNNLSVAVQLSRMGLFRQVSRAIRGRSFDDLVMRDFLRAFVEGADTHAILSIFRTLFVNHSGQELAWKVVDAILSTNADPKSAAYLSQLALHTVAVSGRDHLGLSIDQALIPRFLATVDEVAQAHYGSLAKNVSVIADLLRSPRAAWIARALWEDGDRESKQLLAEFLQDVLNDPSRGVDLVGVISAMDADPVASASWKTFRARLDALSVNAPYQDLKIEALVRDALHFFQEESGAGQPATSSQVRDFISKTMTSKRDGASPSEMEELVLLLSRKPNDVYQILETLSHYTENGELKEFIKLARRSLSEPPRH